MAQSITLYTAKFCPFSHRVEMTLAEAKIDATKYYLNLSDKPSWYAGEVNAEGKVPAIAYGAQATESAPSPPPQDTQILTESNLLCEFISDLSSNSQPLTSSPLTRYKIRTFTSEISSTLIPSFMGFLRLNKPAQGVYDGINKLQEWIEKNGGEYAVGNEFTLADIVVVPFIARMEVTFKNDIGTYPEGEGKKLWETLTTDKKYEVFQKYWAKVKARESFVKTFDEELVTREFAEKYKDARKTA